MKAQMVLVDRRDVPDRSGFERGFLWSEKFGCSRRSGPRPPFTTIHRTSGANMTRPYAALRERVCVCACVWRRRV